MRRIWRPGALPWAPLLVLYSVFSMVLLYYWNRSDPGEGQGARSFSPAEGASLQRSGHGNSFKNVSDCDRLDDEVIREVDQLLKLRQKRLSDYCAACLERRKVPLVAWARRGSEKDRDREQDRDRERTCGFPPTDSAQYFTNILVDDANRMLYCMVPKVASTNWKRTLVLLQRYTGKESATHHTIPPEVDVHNRQHMRNMGFSFLSEHAYTDRRRRILNYLKVIFVRDPWARFLSAYRDKMVANTTWSAYFRQKYGRPIARMRNARITDSAASDTNVTLAEFTRFIVSAYRTGRRVDAHWTPQYDLCHPCLIEYNFIGRFETLERDARRLLHRLWVTNKEAASGRCPPTFPRTNVRRSTTAAAGQQGSDVMSAYSDVAPNDLSDLYKYFKPDMDMFGYDVPLIPRTNQVLT